MYWPGFREDGSLALPLPMESLLPADAPLRLRLDGHVLERKHELHMTLLGRDAGAVLRDRLGENRVRALFQDFDWKPTGTGRYALLHKTKEQWDGPLPAWSLIEHLQAPAFSAFRHELARTGDLDLDSGVPHVTLYVKGDPYGIGLADVATYRACFVREVQASDVLREPVLPR